MKVASTGKEQKVEQNNTMPTSPPTQKQPRGNSNTSTEHRRNPTQA